jgi:hypothetical protein
MGAIIVQIAQHEPWHSEDKTHDFVFFLNECSKMLNNKGWICMFNLSTNKCYNEWKKLVDFWICHVEARLLTLALSHHINHVYFDVNATLCHFNLGST